MSLSHPTPYLEFSPKPRVILKFPLPPASSPVQPFCPPQEILHSGTISSKFPVKLKTVCLTEKKMMLRRENCQASVSREPPDLCHQDGALRCQMQASGGPPLRGSEPQKPMPRATLTVRKPPGCPSTSVFPQCPPQSCQTRPPSSHA